MRLNRKELLKNKKLVGGMAAAVLVTAAAVTTAFLWPHSTPEPAPISEAPNVTTSLPAVSTPETTGSKPVLENDTPDEGSEAVDVNVALENPTAPTGGTPTERPKDDDSSKTEQPARPVRPVEPEQPDDEGGIQIGDGNTSEAYFCGSQNHRCKSAEAHAYLLSLELEGCPHCGSHSCPSFYGTDEWGNTGLTPELCPKYDEKKDPVKYCQDCGKKTGDGSGDTCAQFVEDCDCPFCGKHVKAWTCHTCK